MVPLSVTTKSPTHTASIEPSSPPNSPMSTTPSNALSALSVPFNELHVSATPFIFTIAPATGPSDFKLNKKRKYKSPSSDDLDAVVNASFVQPSKATMPGTLDSFFKPVTPDVVEADRARMSLEWREDMERSRDGRAARAEQALRLKREASAQCQRRFRSRKVADQIESGKRDVNGKINHTKVISDPISHKQPLT